MSLVRSASGLEMGHLRFCFTIIWLLHIWQIDAATITYGHEVPSENKVKNWDFEQPISSNDWVMKFAKGTKVSGGNTGGSALKVDGRTHINGGPYQKISGLKGNYNYYFSVFVKLLNNGPASNPYVSVRTFCNCAGTNINVGRLVYQMKDDTWNQLGGDFKLPNGKSEVECFVRVEPDSVNYLVDTAGFVEIPKRNDWNTYLDNKIRQHRASQLTVSGTLPSSVNPSKTIVRVKMVNPAFCWGTAMKAVNFMRNGPTETKYRDFILKHFNCASFENDMKLKGMEAEKGKVKYASIDAAMQVLLQNNFRVRAHTYEWDVSQANPAWLLKMKGPAVWNEVSRRIDYLTTHYKGKMWEYDVNNEMMHGHVLEKQSGYNDITERMFKEAHKKDPKAILCLNDYQVTRTGDFTSGQADLAKNLLKKGAPVGCIGIQSHLRVLPMDYEVLEWRVKIAASAGIAVSITELSLHSMNMATRAAGVEMAVKIYFSNPKVHCICFWGFGTEFGVFANDFFLTQGPNFIPNAAGNKFLSLMREYWTTEDIKPSGNKISKTLTAFHGQYELQVIEDGTIKSTKKFTVGAAPAKVSL